MLEQQLLAVCRQARLDDYLMGERYDMNYIFYQDDKNWHGAATIMNIPAYLSGTCLGGIWGCSPIWMWI